MKATYVFGHRNPDTDSVCSAISFSYLKNQLGENTLPRVLGHINKESSFVLNHFGVKEPDYLNNVKVQVRDIHYCKDFMMRELVSIKDVVDFMQENHCTAVPIVDEKKHLISLITLKEIAMMFIENTHSHLTTSYDLILKAVNGQEILRFKEEFDGETYAGSYQSQTFIEKAPLKTSDILIVGDRFKSWNSF